MSKSTVSIADSTLVIPSDMVISSETRRKIIGLVAVVLALVVTNFALLIVLLVKPSTGNPAGPKMFSATERDLACIQVLRNGGVPEDCSRMYHLDFYP